MATGRVLPSDTFWEMLTPYLKGIPEDHIRHVAFVIVSGAAPIEILLTLYQENAMLKMKAKKFSLYDTEGQQITGNMFLGELQKNFPYLQDEALHVTRLIVSLRGHSFATMQVSLDFE